MSDTEDQKPQRPHRGHRRSGRRHRRVGLWVLSSILTLSVLGGLLVMSLMGAQITAPDWLRTRIIERINQGSDRFSIKIGDVAVIIEKDFLPRLLLRNVALNDTSGNSILQLSDVETSVALQPLLRGQIQPTSILLSGAGVTLRRLENGRVTLVFNDMPSLAEGAVDYAALVRGVDGFLMRPQFADLNDVTIENLTVRYDDLRISRAWTVDGGHLGMMREGDDLQIRGNFTLLGARDYATSLEMNYSGRIGSLAAEMGVSFEDMPAREIAGQSPALVWLEALDAPMSGALRVSVDETGALGPLNATLQISEGVLQPTEATKPIPFTSVRSYFSYDPNTQTMQLDELSVDSKWGSAQAEGQAILLGVENGLPQELLGQIRVSKIKANPAGLYPQPIEIEAANMDVRLQFNPFALTVGEMSFTDQDSRFVVQGEARAKAGGWDLTVSGQMDAITRKRLMEIWPVGVEEKSRSWVAKNVYEANISNIQVAMRLLPNQIPDVLLGFDYKGLKTRFVKDVPPIEAAAGHASLYDNRFAITASSGYVAAAQGGRIDISGTSFIVPDVRIKRGPAHALLQTSSTITATLSLLDEKPFRFMQKADQPVTLASGRATMSGRLDFLLKPKLQTKEVAFDLDGTLKSVRSEILVPGRVLVASELSVSARNDLLRIGGEGRLGTVPVGGFWQSDLTPESGKPSQLKGWIELSERFTDEFGIGLPPGSISGVGRADITVDLAKGKPGKFTLSSDLAGVGLSLRQLGWSASRETKGILQAAGELGAPPVIDDIRLEAAGLIAHGSVSLREGGELERASFSEVKVGTWLDAPVDLIGRGAGLPPAVEVSGGRIDLRQTSLGGSGGGGQNKNGGPVSLALDSLQISDGIALTQFRANLDMSRGVAGNFTGQVNGGAAITGRVVPQDGRSAFQIKSSNAGGVMSSAGLLKQAREGKLDLVLTPAPEKGSYKGKLKIESLRIKDAPAMAALLNAISVVGILEQLRGSGLYFNRV
ncbi:Large exoproteins involved in heme utilization or adhesion, partial [hydrothermal vent metagenome]